ncbi:MAG: C25 family cysteine peptidase, partial [Chromatiaceae bacterium]
DHWGQRGQGLGAINSAAGPANRAAIGVRETGLYQVSTSALALALDWPEGKVKGLIQAGQLRLTNQGADVAWQAVAKGQGLIFYGEASRSIYDPENVYVVQQGTGTRMAEIQVVAKGPVGAASFPTHLTLEENRFAATVRAKDPEEDYWFWGMFNAAYNCQDITRSCRAQNFTLQVPAPATAATGTATLTLQLRGDSTLPATPDHQVTVTLNDTPLGIGTWDGLADLSLSLPFPPSLLREGANSVRVEAQLPAGVAYNYFYLDRFELAYPRQYLAIQDSLVATGQPGQLLVASGFATKAIQVFDLSDTQRPRAVTGAKIQNGSGGYQVSLVPASATTPYLLVADGAVRAPTRVRPLETTGLVGPKAGAPYLVIAPRDFYDEATQPVQRLLSLRSSQGLSGRFVPLQALYDEYGDGQKTPHAIRRFLAEALRTWQVPPAYVLLAGKGTVDPKDYLGYSTDRLPVLMTLTPDAGVIATDQRFVDVDGDGLGDLALGRLPAATAAEFAGMVDKLIAYEDAGPSPVPHAILLADGPDAGGNYTLHSEASAARLLEAGLADSEVQRLYLERMTAAAARTALLADLHSGADLLNYYGHAGVIALDHNLLTVADAVALTDQGQLPVILGMTCLMNRFEIPQLLTLGEALLRNPAGGAAAVWSSGGYSFDTKASALNDAVLEALLQLRVPRLGDAIQAALSGTALSLGPTAAAGVYNLLGDPATVNLFQ